MTQQLQGRRVIFTAERQVQLEEFELDSVLGPQEALVRGKYSVISPGTEGAGYTGLVRQMATMREQRSARTRRQPEYPRTTGYGHLGEVLAIGSEVDGVEVGDTVTSFANHASLVKADTGRFCLPIPSSLSLDDQRAVFVRMAGVAITAVRSANVSAGDKVLVIGLGLVGNFAAQLFQLAGAEVLASDTIDERRAIAEQCGIARTVNPMSEDLEAAVLDWTTGHGVDIAVEAIGRSELIAEAVELTRRHGELILLGSPRAHHTMDVTPMLTRIHLLGITLRGALEWLYPIPETPSLKHSITRNYRQLLEWMASGRLVVDPVRTHVLPPEQCTEAYAGLMDQKDRYLGVVFDWTSVKGA